jgi:hypothetical protein
VPNDFMPRGIMGVICNLCMVQRIGNIVKLITTVFEIFMTVNSSLSTTFETGVLISWMADASNPTEDLSGQLIVFSE